MKSKSNESKQPNQQPFAQNISTNEARIEQFRTDMKKAFKKPQTTLKKIKKLLKEAPDGGIDYETHTKLVTFAKNWNVVSSIFNFLVTENKVNEKILTYFIITAGSDIVKETEEKHAFELSCTALEMAMEFANKQLESGAADLEPLNEKKELLLKSLFYPFTNFMNTSEKFKQYGAAKYACYKALVTYGIADERLYNNFIRIARIFYQYSDGRDIFFQALKNGVVNILTFKTFLHLALTCEEFNDADFALKEAIRRKQFDDATLERVIYYAGASKHFPLIQFAFEMAEKHNLVTNRIVCYYMLEAAKCGYFEGIPGALDLARTLNLLFPEPIIVNLITLCGQSGKNEEIMKIFQYAKETTKSNKIISNNCISQLGRNNQFGNAEIIFKYLKDTEQADIDTFINFIGTAQLCHQFKEALDAFEEIEKKQSVTGGLVHNMIQLAYQYGELEYANGLFLDYIELFVPQYASGEGGLTNTFSSGAKPKTDFLEGNSIEPESKLSKSNASMENSSKADVTKSHNLSTINFHGYNATTVMLTLEFLLNKGDKGTYAFIIGKGTHCKIPGKSPVLEAFNEFCNKHSLHPITPNEKNPGLVMVSFNTLTQQEIFKHNPLENPNTTTLPNKQETGFSSHCFFYNQQQLAPDKTTINQKEKEKEKDNKPTEVTKQPQKLKIKSAPYEFTGNTTSHF